MKFTRLLALTLLLILAMTFSTVSAQDEEMPGPGEGGTIIEGNQRGSGNLGPLVLIRCSGVDCSNPGGLLFPALIGVNPSADPAEQVYQAGLPGTLAEDYEISEDGLTYTFTLREGLTWSDGEAITAEDVLFTSEAIRSGEEGGISSSYSSHQQDVISAEIIDDYTIAFSFEAPNCDAIRSSSIPVIPAHVYGFSADNAVDFDFSVLIDHPMDDQPSSTFGPFKFNRVEPGNAVYLEADQNWSSEAEDGLVRPSGFVYLDVPDENVMVERFLTFQVGEPNFVREPDANLIPTLEESDAQTFSSPGRLWHYVSLNLADPENPENGFDEEGNPIDQGQHPLFGDVRVRQALQHAINIDEIINGPLNGNASAMTAGTIPTAYTVNPDITPRAYDLDEARRLLDEAGWEATGEPLVDGGDGLRTCTSCETAEAGTEFRMELMNVGDVRNDVSVILQDQFADIGVAVEVQVLDFNTMYDENMGAQIYDAAVAGWRGALPFDPDLRSFFGAQNDVFGEGYGFNFPSYYNEEFEELGAQIVEGDCSQETILDAAYRMQEILYEEQPYLWLYAFNSAYSAAPQIANFDGRPNFGSWNIDQWAFIE